MVLWLCGILVFWHCGSWWHIKKLDVEVIV